ncbi:MAG: hypothetical protein RIT45_2633 [Pseudomonadota bacterium]
MSRLMPGDPPKQLFRLSIRWAFALGLVTLGAGCGGVQFDRTSGAFKYRALPVGTPVQVVESASALPQPQVDVGELRWKQEGSAPAPDRKGATERFVRHAGRYGCDAVVGLKVESAEKKTVKKTKKLGADGKPVYEETEVSTFSHAFTARCVRTAAAPGGLQDGGDAAVAASGPAPKLSAAAMPPKPPVTTEPTEPSSGAGETDADVLELWRALGRYEKSFLKNWADRLVGAPGSASEALEAMGELMTQVSGPTGLWRRTVPQEWFGCVDNPGSPQCTKLAAANEEFAAWDRFAEQMARQKGSSAKGWLKRNKSRMMGYMDRYVPSVASLSGLQGTPLYAEKVR